MKILANHVRNPYGFKIGKHVFSILDLCDSPKDVIECLRVLVPSSTLDKILDHQFIDENGHLTQHGKIIYTAYELKLKPAACLLLLDLFLQHRSNNEHSLDCHVDVSSLKHHLSLFSVRNRKMIPSELASAGFIYRDDYNRYCLNHNKLKDILSLKYLDDLISHLQGNVDVEAVADSLSEKPVPELNL